MISRPFLIVITEFNGAASLISPLFSGTSHVVSAGTWTTTAALWVIPGSVSFCTVSIIFRFSINAAYEKVVGITSALCPVGLEHSLVLQLH